jgi:DNA-binding transcriptional MocR family regulator
MKPLSEFLSHRAGAMRESAIRQMGTVLAQSSDIVSFAPGYPAEDAFPWTAFEEIADALLSGREGAALQYGPTRGYRPLLEAVAGLMRDRGAEVSSDRLLVTSGSQQGLDLIARVLLDPGDVALMELPSYTGAISAFRNLEAALVGVRQEADGLSLEDLDRTVARLRADGRRVKFLYLVPNFQNPTGLMISRDKRLAVLDWAARRDVLLVEDDPYRDLYFPDVTSEAETRPIVADDRDDRVIYLSSFSKTLAPGLRVGWMSAPPAIAARLELAKQATDLSTGTFDQRVVYECCRRGVLAAHIPDLRRRYQEKRDAMVAALRAELGDALSWPDPKGGFFLWARLPEGLTGNGLLPIARRHGVIYVAGAAFFVDDTGEEFIRLSFSAPSADRIREGVKRLARSVAEAAELATRLGAAPSASARQPHHS